MQYKTNTKTTEPCLATDFLNSSTRSHVTDRDKQNQTQCTHLLYKHVVFENSACFHDSHNGCLQKHLAIVIHGTVSALHILKTAHSTEHIKWSK